MKIIDAALFAPLCLLAACDGDFYGTTPDLSIDPSPEVVGNSVYMLSGINRTLVKVTPGAQGDSEDARYTDLESVEVQAIHVGTTPRSLTITPDRSRLLVLSHEKDEHLLAVVDPAATCTGEGPVDPGCVSTLEAKPLHDRLVLSPDSRFAISYISLESAEQSDAEVINLNEVGVYDLQAGTVRFALLGFNPNGFAFTGSETNPRVVAITSSKVISLDLMTGETIPRELTLGTETHLTPKDVVITGDDRHALVTIEGSPDLFTFDLTQSTLPINILSLSDTPGDMALSASGNETLILTRDRAELNIVHHEDLSIDVFSLTQPANTILVPPDTSYAVLYDASGQGRYLYYVDLLSDRVQAYLLDNPCSDVRASPDGGALVIFYTPDSSGSSYDGSSLDGSNAVAILNLAQGDRQPNPILVSFPPLDAVFMSGLEPQLDQVFVPFDTYDHGLVARFNLTTYDSTVVETPPLPRYMGLLDDSRVIVVHGSPLGLISIFPANNPDLIQFVSGFLTAEVL